MAFSYKSIKEKKSCDLHLRVSEDIKEWISKKSIQWNVSESEVVRIVFNSIIARD